MGEAAAKKAAEEEEAARKKKEAEEEAKRKAEEEEAMMKKQATVYEKGEDSLAQLTDAAVWRDLGIPATERETFLPESKFQELFGVSKADFAKLPKWKRDGQKKKHGLF